MSGEGGARAPVLEAMLASYGAPSAPPRTAEETEKDTLMPAPLPRWHSLFCTPLAPPPLALRLRSRTAMSRPGA